MDPTLQNCNRAHCDYDYPSSILSAILQIFTSIFWVLRSFFYLILCIWFYFSSHLHIFRRNHQTIRIRIHKQKPHAHTWNDLYERAIKTETGAEWDIGQWQKCESASELIKVHKIHLLRFTQISLLLSKAKYTRYEVRFNGFPSTHTFTLHSCFIIAHSFHFEFYVIHTNT